MVSPVDTTTATSSRFDEDDPEAWFQYASAAARLGRFALADSALDRALEGNPIRPGALFLRGWIRESTGRSAEAVVSRDVEAGATMAAI